MPSLCGEKAIILRKLAEKKAIILRKLAENMLPILGVWGKVMSKRVNEWTSERVACEKERVT